MEIPEKVKKNINPQPETEPIYYVHPYQCEFIAEVTQVKASEGYSYIILDRTAFFPEGGGQKGDQGYLQTSSKRFKILEALELDGVTVHLSKTEVSLGKGEWVEGVIDWDIRYERMKQHTASHVLFSAIKKGLGLDSLTYMGVQINEDTSRIDISYGKPISWTKLREIEREANKICAEDRSIKISYMSRDDADEKFGNDLGLTEITPSGVVRVVKIAGWDVALCSGTHVASTKEIGLINILDRYRLKKGVERIEFTAGKKAYQRYADAISRLSIMAGTLQTSISEVPNRLNTLLSERNSLKEEFRSLQSKLTEFRIERLVEEAETIGEYEIVKGILTLDAKTLKNTAVKLTDGNPNLVAILGADYDNKAIIVGTAGKNTLKTGIDMSILIDAPIKIIQGGGGGNRQIAQGGGNLKEKLPKAVETYLDNVRKFLQK